MNKILIFVIACFVFIPGAAYGLTEINETSAQTKIFFGQTDGWAIINNEASRASMSFIGNGTSEDSKWKLQSLVKINSVEEINVDLRGWANSEDGKIRLTGFGKGPNNVEFMVILRGNFAPVENSENVYALDWSYAGIHWFYDLHDNKKVRLFQNGFIFVTSS